MFRIVHTSGCNGSFYRGINDIDYCLPIFGKCNGSFHGGIDSVEIDYLYCRFILLTYIWYV